MRQPDIEIYLKDADQAAITRWLEGYFNTPLHWIPQGRTFKTQAGTIPITWLPQAVGKWHCLLLESDSTPWEHDLACAQAAYQALGVEVRCMPGSWQEEESEEEADRWISVGPQGEREILWRT